MKKSRLYGAVCAAIVRIIGPMSAAILMLQSGSAFSGLIGDRTELEAILGGSLVLEDFESVELFFPFHAPNEWFGPILDSSAGIVDGIVFTRDPTGSLSVKDPRLQGGNQVLITGSGAIAIDFLSPTVAFGFDFDRPTNTETEVTLNVFAEDDVTLLSSETISLFFDSFIGFSELNGIGKATVSSFSVSIPHVTETRIDNVTFGSIVFGETDVATEYFPLADGNSWTYRVTGTSGTYNETMTVLPGTTIINSVATKAIQYSGGNIDYFTSDINGIQLHRGYDPNTPPITTWTFSPPLAITYGTMSIPEIVNSSGIVWFTHETAGTFPLNYTATSETEVREAVSVPAGTYEAVRLRDSTRIYGNIQGDEIDFKEWGNTWMVKHIGMIKQTLYDDEGREEEWVMTSTNVKPPVDEESVRFLPFLLPLLLD